MSTTTASPATTPMPVQLSEPEFEACILPYLSMPKRGPKCKLGYHRVFNLILWVLYTGMQWKCLPIPHDTQGKPAIHYTTIYKVFATWADDGSLWQAFMASVRHLATEKHLDTSILHGDGTNTVAKKGAMASGTRGTNTRRGRRSSPSRTTTAMCELRRPLHPSTPRSRGCGSQQQILSRCHPLIPRLGNTHSITNE
jgi:transposase